MPAPRSVRQFRADLRLFVRDCVHREGEKALRRVCEAVLTGIVRSSPVDTGRFKGNWLSSVGAPSTAAYQDRFSPDGGLSLGSGLNVIRNLRLGQTYWLANNLDYAGLLEDGHSKQAPNGVVMVNLVKVVSRFGGQISR